VSTCVCVCVFRRDKERDRERARESERERERCRSRRAQRLTSGTMTTCILSPMSISQERGESKRVSDKARVNI
jgi:hypothetical protein